MAKDNRKIHSGVRHEGTTYKDGMEDELAAVMGEDQLQRLAEKGAISGNWVSTAVVADEETASEETAAETEPAAGKKAVGKKAVK